MRALRPPHAAAVRCLVVAAVALFVALGGPAEAQRLLSGSDIEKGTVTPGRSRTARWRRGPLRKARRDADRDAGPAPSSATARSPRHDRRRSVLARGGRRGADRGRPRARTPSAPRSWATTPSARPRSATTASARRRSPTTRSTAARSSTAGCSRATSRASAGRWRSASTTVLKRRACRRRSPTSGRAPTSPGTSWSCLAAACAGPTCAQLPRAGRRPAAAASSSSPATPRRRRHPAGARRVPLRRHRRLTPRASTARRRRRPTRRRR